MNNQLTHPETEVWKRKLIWIVTIVAIATLIVGFGVLQIQKANTPYIKTVLSLDGNPNQGHEIFLMNCAGCHALQSERQVGPSLEGVSQRKSEIGLIYQVISGQTPPMPQFQPNPQEMADLLSYLEQL